jgi:hypothetical protein
LAAVAEMLDQVFAGNLFGDFEGTLDFVNGVEAADTLGVGYGKGNATFTARGQVALGGGVKRVQGDFVFAQSIGEFADGLGIAVIEMVGSAKNFDRGETGRRNLAEKCIVKLLIQEPVGGKYALH